MEVMVSVSIFAIVVTVGIVALVSINDAYRKSEASRQTIDSLTYVLESMSRRIRTAQSWTLISPTSLKILDQDGITVTYSWDQTNEKMTMDIDNSTCTPQPQCATDANVQDGTYDITPTDVHVTDHNLDGTVIPGGGFTFTMFGVSAGTQGKQSYVQINLGGYSNDGRQVSDFAFQTGVSKRALDP